MNKEQLLKDVKNLNSNILEILYLENNKIIVKTEECKYYLLDPNYKLEEICNLKIRNNTIYITENNEEKGFNFEKDEIISLKKEIESQKDKYNRLKNRYNKLKEENNNLLNGQIIGKIFLIVIFVILLDLINSKLKEEKIIKDFKNNKELICIVNKNFDIDDVYKINKNNSLYLENKNKILYKNNILIDISDCNLKGN